MESNAKLNSKLRLKLKLKLELSLAIIIIFNDLGHFSIAKTMGL